MKRKIDIDAVRSLELCIDALEKKMNFIDHSLGKCAYIEKNNP